VDVFEEVRAHGILPVVEIDHVDSAAPLAEALLAGGLPCAEITMRTEAALPAIGVIADRYPELLLGAGTVMNPVQAGAAVEAGCRFVVCPGFDIGVVDWCVERQIPIVPGVSTPTEINMALAQGLDVVKFFPAEASGGRRWIAAIAPAYPDVRFVPTGGIGPDNLADYLRMPTVLACGGSWLVSSQLIADRDFRRITDLTIAATAVVRDARAG